MMRELTETQRAAMNEALGEMVYPPITPRENFITGFCAGLECADAQNADLLAALRGLVQFQEFYFEHLPAPQVLKEARDALARAEGTDPR